MAGKNKRRTLCDVERRAGELARLRKVTGRRSIGRFVAALRDPAFAAAKMATMGLCDRGAIVGPLTEMLADADPAVRWRACSLPWFFRIEEMEGQLVRALGDPDTMVRTEAAWALRWARTNAAAKALLAATKDPEPIVAHYAGWVLRRTIKPRHPDLPALRGGRIPAPALKPEPSSRTAPVGEIANNNNAEAFKQFACSTSLPAVRAAMGARPGRSGRGKLRHIDGYP
ncbi:hypothetical protein LCGC14_2290870, partial [marine sediment metagenome]